MCLRFIRQVICVFWVLWPLSSWATAASNNSFIDVAPIREQQDAASGMDWCIAPLNATREQIASGGCVFQSLLRGTAGHGYRIGFQRDSVWLRLRVRNSSAQDIERWIETGLPRATDVTVYREGAGGDWKVSRLGMAVPRAARGFVESHYNVTSLIVPAGASAEVFIRVQSKPLIDLRTRLWEPQAYLAYRQTIDAWLSLTIGGFLLGFFVTVLMFVTTRQSQYGFFALSIVGEALIESIRNGFLMRYLWPETLPLPVEITNLGGLLAVVGFSGYVLEMVPEIRNLKWLYTLLRALIVFVCVFQLVGLVIDFQLGTRVWGLVVIPLALFVMFGCYLGLRAGRGFARWALLALAFLGVVAILRSPQLTQIFPHFWIDILLSPLAMLSITSLVLIGLSERSRELERQLGESKASGQSQVAFLARMSHELRTPLDTVLGNAQLLMRGGAQKAQSRELIGILQSGRHLLGMIDEILDFSRGVAGALKLRCEPITLKEYFVSIEISARILASRNRNRFVVRQVSGGADTAELTVELDAGRLRQVLDNLIANAARHTFDGSITLEYDVKLLRDGRYWLSLAVIDTGEGIAAEDQSRVFQPFERVGRNARYGGKGAGMGLAVAKQLVALMGGELTLESALGQGSTFRFSLITKKAAQSAESRMRDVVPIDARGYEGPQRLALVIDDDAGSRAIFSAVLERAGFLTQEAESGNLALAMLSDLPRLDLIVTDQFMPDGDGWAVLEGAAARCPTVPCVMISAAPPSPPEKFPPALHFAASFLKPVDHANFLQKIGQILGLTWVAAAPATAGDAVIEHPDSRSDAHPEDRAQPGAAELAELREMIELGEVTAIRDWARRLRQQVPEFARFAEQVESAALDLDFTTLATLSNAPQRSGSRA